MFKMNDTDEVRLGDMCSICGKPVRYWHDYWSESDDLINTKWHKRCAKDYETWLYKITHILPSAESSIDVPINYRWDRYFENYQRRVVSGLSDKKTK